MIRSRDRIKEFAISQIFISQFAHRRVSTYIKDTAKSVTLSFREVLFPQSPRNAVKINRRALYYVSSTRPSLKAHIPGGITYWYIIGNSRLSLEESDFGSFKVVLAIAQLASYYDYEVPCDFQVALNTAERGRGNSCQVRIQAGVSQGIHSTRGGREP